MYYVNNAVYFRPGASLETEGMLTLRPSTFSVSGNGGHSMSRRENHQHGSMYQSTYQRAAATPAVCVNALHLATDVTATSLIVWAINSRMPLRSQYALYLFKHSMHRTEQ
jgi:hypothetical protein